MADPETPTHGLAERLEADAERWDLDHCCSVDVADIRAAAAQLRQLDRIKAVVQTSRCPRLGLGYEEPGCGTCEFCRIRKEVDRDAKK